MSLGGILAGIHILGGLFGHKKRPQQQTTVIKNEIPSELRQFANSTLPDANNLKRELLNSIQGRMAGQIPKASNVLTEQANQQMQSLLSNPYQSSINTQAYGQMQQALQNQYDIARQEAEKRMLDQMSKLGITRSSATINQMGDIERKLLADQQQQMSALELQKMRDIENANLTQRQLQEREINQAAGLGYQGLQAWNDLYYRAMNDAMNLYNMQTSFALNALGRGTTATQTHYMPTQSGFQSFLDMTAPIAGRWLEQQIYPQTQPMADQWWNSFTQPFRWLF